MEVNPGAAGGSGGDEGENQNHQEEKRILRNRHAPNQTSRLEQLFSMNPHPDEVQRQVMAQELGMSTKQIKFWFQNRRTQQKTRLEREDNNALRAENERMMSELLVLRETLNSNTLLCQTCGGPMIVDDQAYSLVQLQFENQRLKDELEKVYQFISSYKEINPMSGAELQLGPPSLENSYDAPNPPPNTALGMSASKNQGLNHLGGEIPELPKSAKEKRAEVHRALMYEAVKGAKEELFRLLFTEEPLWVQSPTNSKRQVIDPLIYDEMFAKANHFNTPTARVESSKDSLIVKISALQLVNMLMDQEMWANVFSTIISKALTLEVLDKGMQTNRNGALQLMFEEMHILSPLVPPREFFILRYCQKVEENNGWVIGDVSFDYKKKGTSTTSTSTSTTLDDDDALRAWKRPSGCFIQPLPDGTSSRVTWVEHVEVDDALRMPRLYRDVITSGAAGYGAERWVTELQRMTQKFDSLSLSPTVTTFNIGGGVMTLLPEGKKNLMKISQRMVSSFCGILNISSRLHYPKQLTGQQGTNNNNNISGIRVSVRWNSETRYGHPIGTTAVAAISLWLPLPSHQLFDFFRDPNNRVQWDALSAGQPMHEAGHFSTGSQPGNYISVIQSCINPGGGNNVLIIQETFTNRSGSYIVFTPLSVLDFTAGVQGRGTRTVALLPSGITISEDGEQQHYSSDAKGASSSSSSGNGGKPRGSILTLSYQFLVDDKKDYGGVKIETVAAANSLITTMVDHIKTALNCPLVEYI